MFAAVFVDDILIACANLDVLSQVKRLFCKSFEMTDLGPVKEFLGVRITQDQDSITMDQSTYIDKMLEKFSGYIIPARNYSGVPMKRGHIRRGEAPSTETQRKFVQQFPYSEIVGSVLYLSVITRADIAYSVGVLTRHMKKPTYDACIAACRLLLYLKKTRNRGLRYHGRALNLHAFTDSDWAGDLDTRRSTSGYVVVMAGAPIVWMSKLQPIVAVSSMEAEYIAAFFVIQEVTWIRAVLLSLGLARSDPTPVSIDNKSARDLALSPVHHQRSKHIDVKYH